ncbi:hypothetical protein JOB18_004282 [Solea senegalensis]|uniref:Uncharacterized protein n=1 Tax=Solea senegalensis TaxID=28829 RepID=A0AAV6RU35_SOLSE|nr:hypothetical protein JOB18_004282 [Solea senegalensis]
MKLTADISKGLALLLCAYFTGLLQGSQKLKPVSVDRLRFACRIGDNNPGDRDLSPNPRQDKPLSPSDAIDETVALTHFESERAAGAELERSGSRLWLNSLFELSVQAIVTLQTIKCPTHTGYSVTPTLWPLGCTSRAAHRDKGSPSRLHANEDRACGCKVQAWYLHVRDVIAYFRSETSKEA